MKATGIVRRIDDLGRVVIPKEIRRTMRIREGDPLEIFTDREGEVIFKKYSPIGELTSFASQYADTLHKIGGLAVAITDRDGVIAASGVPRRDYADKRLSEGLGEIINKRGLYVWREGEERIPVSAGSAEEERARFVGCAMPILCEGDIIGCVASLRGGEDSKSADGTAGSTVSSDVEVKLVQTAANFLGKQLEN